jgi:hypothetical protein
LEQGDLTAARTTATEALSIREDLGERSRVADNRLQLAQVAYENGDFPTAEVEAQKLVALFRSEQSIESEANALAICALAALAQGHPVEAGTAIKGIEALLPRVATRTVHLRLLLTQALVHAASGRTSAGRAAAQSVLDQARRFHLGVIEFEARVVVSQIALAADDSRKALGELQGLEREATNKGLGLVARRIRNLLALQRRTVSRPPSG